MMGEQKPTPRHEPSPPDPRYGWVIVAIAAVAMAATLPGRTHGLGLITKRLLDDFSQLTQSDFAQINLWATLIGAAFCLPCGWLIDKLGIRITLTAVLAGLASAVLWMSAASDVWSLTLAITLTRGIGQSMLSVVSITMIGKWFSRNLGLAMGVYSVQMSLLMATATGLLGSRVTQAGWREGWWEVGLVLAAITPLCLLFTRNAAQSTRLEPEADSAVGASATLRQALASPCFWVFALSISFFGMVSAGISLFQQFILEERGLSEQVYQNSLIIGLLVGMVTNLAVGGLTYVVRLQHILGAAMLLLGATYASLTFVRTPEQAYAFAASQGVAGGMLTVLFFAVWRHAFGAVHLGRIQGAAQMLTVLASAIGPLLVAESQAASGTYVRILTVFAAISAAFGVVAALTPVPHAQAGDWKPAEPNESTTAVQESLA